MSVEDNCTFTNNIFSGNSAGNYGGGVAASDNCIFINTIFIGNSATDGGAVGIMHGTFTNNTFSENSARTYGGAIRASESSILTNNIFWDNIQKGSKTDPGADIYVAKSNNTCYNNMMQLSKSSYSSKSLNAIQSNNDIFAQDPKFTNAADLDGNDNIHRTADDGLTLQWSSPCINKGMSGVGIPTTDILGAPRFGVAPEMGAYESMLLARRDTLYVNEQSGNNNIDVRGISWDSAYTHLSHALAEAAQDTVVKVILVAKGTYKPTGFPLDVYGSPTVTGERDKTFFIRDSLNVYGGYPNTGGAVRERDIKANETILSGDLGKLADKSDNSLHVVMASGTKGVMVDGFTIQDGNANLVGGEDNQNMTGGGVYLMNGNNVISKNIIRNNSAGGYGCGISSNQGYTSILNNTISNNTGVPFTGGMFSLPWPCTMGGGIVINGDSAIINNIIDGNSSYNGGGIHIKNGTFNINGNYIVNNIARETNTKMGFGGGIMIESNANANISNNIIAKNSSFAGGGICKSSGSIVYIVNNTIFNNSVDVEGGGIYLIGKSDTIANNIFWKNTSKTSTPDLYSNFLSPSVIFKNNLFQLPQASYTKTNNNDLGTNATGNLFNFDPMFVNDNAIDGGDKIYRTDDDGLALKVGSPCINKGDTGKYIPAYDILNRARIMIPDMGAYEEITDPTDDTLYVDQSRTNIQSGDKGITWATAFRTLDEALTEANKYLNVKVIKVAEGEYMPRIRVAQYSLGEITTYHIREGLALYGGYPNGGGARNILKYKTILKGAEVDLRNRDFKASLNVVVIANSFVNSKEVILDGFTIVNPGMKNSKQTQESAVKNKYSLSINGNDIAMWMGGAIYIAKGNVTLNNLIIQDFVSKEYGSAIAAKFSDVKINNSFFISNTSETSGGAIYSFNGTLKVTNSVFTDNQSKFGGAIYAEKCVTDFINNTFAKNKVDPFSFTVDGGACMFYSNSGNIYNNIFWKNGVQGDDISVVFGNMSGYNIHNNLFTSDAIKSGLSGADTSASGMIYGLDPSFVDTLDVDGADNILFTADDGFNLKAGSPCINKGLNVNGITPFIDIIGKSRWDTIDIGAYEYSPWGVSVPKLEQDGHVKLYPNPTQGIISIEADASVENITITIVNSIGQNILSKTIVNQNNPTIDLSSYPSGIYFITVQAGHGMETYKIFKHQ